MAIKLVRAVSWPEGQLKRGVVLHRTVEYLACQSYLLYLPAARKKRHNVLVLVHGQGRNVEVMVDIFRTYAEKHDAILIAPIFDKDISSGYQRLGLKQRGGDGVLPQTRLRLILDEVSQFAEVPIKRFYMFGHSGGAQFCHRYVMAFPDVVKRYAISAAGWYTLPDVNDVFPYGMKANPELPSILPDIDKFLQVPVCVLVGEKDTGRGATVNKSERIDRSQGRTRLERAESWVAAVTAVARDLGLDPSAQLQILPDAGHDFGDMEASGRLARRAAKFLFK